MFKGRSIKERVIHHFHDQPANLESHLYFKMRYAWRRLRVRSLPINKLLCGSIAGLSTIQLYRHLDDIKWASTRIYDSPHALFLLEYRLLGENIFTSPHFEQTAYYRFVANCIDMLGNFCGARTEAQILHLAKNFVRSSNNEAIHNDQLSPNSDCSISGDFIVVSPIRDSDCYQIIDGHHRLACIATSGNKYAKVRILPDRARTPLQELLLSVRWCANKLELYQPIESPELSGKWKTLRKCEDRLSMMLDFLEKNNQKYLSKTYLDVASYYGWFVWQMKESGYDSMGVELDSVAREIGIRIYGLQDQEVARGDAVQFLENTTQAYDVVSCFSLMHHFVMGYGSIGALELLKRLAKATRVVLFFEMAEERETWFQDKLTGWNRDSIQTWLNSSGFFTRVIPLGTDTDSAMQNEGNYGRTTFACIK